MSLQFKGRPVCDIDWDGRGVDSFFISGIWEDSDEDLTESDLEELTDSDSGQDWLVNANFRRHHYYRN